MTLWSLMDAPLIFGGDMTQLDPFTFSLLSNAEVIAVNQDHWANKPRQLHSMES